MPSILADPPVAPHLERAKNAPRAMVKADLRKPKMADPTPEEQASRAQMARVIARVKELSGLNQDQYAERLRKNVRQVAAWIENRERPHFDAVYRVPAFRPLLMQAWGEVLGAEVRTVIEWRRVG